MSLESIDNDNDEQQGLAAQADAGSISFALDALSQLSEAEPQPAPPQAGGEHTAGEQAPHRPEPETAPAEPTVPQDSLQSALDWYKDWLNSI